MAAFVLVPSPPLPRFARRHWKSQGKRPTSMSAVSHGGRENRKKRGTELSNCEQAANIALRQCLNDLTVVSDDEVNQCLLYADELRHRCEIDGVARAAAHLDVEQNESVHKTVEEDMDEPGEDEPGVKGADSPEEEHMRARIFVSTAKGIMIEPMDD
mmetsp:Transcript_3167/g.11444  ORF Transcript_3167/g.11444 Transcript_3167/m.11444 type:complete len:157 (-) Transcript_3167:87-557(-)